MAPPKNPSKTSPATGKPVSLSNAPTENKARAAPKHPRLKSPSFDVDDLKARRQWLWKLAFNTFEHRAAAGEKLDTRFAILLSDLLGMPAADGKDAGRVPSDAMGEFLHNLSVEAFAEYKDQFGPR